MSFRDLARKYQKMIDAKSSILKLIWIDSPAELTPIQIESKTEIYVYLEI